MQPLSLKVLAIILLISYASSQNLGGGANGGANGNLTNTANITFTPPPNITTNSAGTFGASGVTFKTSNRLQLLQISTADDGNGGTTTNFKYSYYNASSATKFNVKDITLPGSWNYITGTQDTLSCTAISNGNGNYSLLKFDSAANTLQLIAKNPLHQNQIAINGHTLTLKENCNGAYFGSVLGVINNVNITTIVDLPVGWSPITTSESLAYGVANGTLYRFNPNSYTFTAVYNFSKTFDTYSFKSVPGKVIVSAATRTTNTAVASGTDPVDIVQTFYFFSDPVNGTFKLIGQYSIESTITPPAGSSATDPSRFLVDFSVSLSFSKFVTVWNPQGGNSSTPRSTIFKNLDFTKGTATDINFKDFAKFSETSRRLQGSNADFAISDNFFVIRNQSAYDFSNTSNAAVEETYQFQGSLISLIRNRVLTANERGTFFKLVIDSTYANELMVVVISLITSGGYTVSVTAYGSLAAMNKIAPTPIPANVSFIIPDGSTASAPANALGWVYKKVDNSGGSPVTNSTYIRFTPNATGSVVSTTDTQPGSWSVLAINELCHIEKEAGEDNYKIVYRKPVSNTNSSLVITSYDLTSVMAGIPLSGAPWQLADNCEIFAVDGQIFFTTGNTTSFLNFPNPNYVFTAFDQNINIGIVNDQVYSLITGSTNIISIYTHTSPILPNNKIYSMNSYKIVITATNDTSAQVIVLTVNPNTGGLMNIMDYVDSSFTSEPSIKVSPGITKVLISGLTTVGGNSVPKFLGFFVDFDNRQYINLTLPSITISSLAQTTIVLLDQFIYIRESTELILYIDQDINPLQVSKVTLTADQITNFKKAVLLADPNGKFYFLVEVSAGNNTQVNVNQNQVSIKQVILNSQAATAVGSAAIVAAVTSTGQLKACPPGCSDCSSGYCTACVGGFSYDSNTYICNLCGPNCVTCNSPNYLQCLTCVPGAFLSSSSTCDRCDPSCVTCGTSATQCSICPPGTGSYSGGCNNCSKNCLTCTSATVCTVCRNGFVVAPDNKCRGCAASCSSCTPGNITQCTSCATGLYLLNSKCVACPNNCLTCSDANTCSACVPGMTPNSKNVCVLNCQLPCITCLDNQPTQCTSCYYGSTLSGNTCVFDSSCNATSSCTDCGQGLNLYLDGTDCVTCPAITNCLQCSAANIDNCARCANGYFVDTGYGCTQCPTQCTSCLSADICTACASGYTLPSSQSSGTCLACTSPCATCQGSSTYCLSCVDGYTKKSWKCQRNKYVGFTFVLNGDPATVLASIDGVIASILAAMGESLTNTDAVTISTAALGSTIISGSATSTDSTVSSAAVSSSIAASVSGGLGGFAVTSSTLTLEGESSSSSDNKTGLIVGLVIGLTVFVGIVIVMSVYMYKKNKVAVLQQISSELQVDVKEDSLQEFNGMKVESKLFISDS